MSKNFVSNEDANSLFGKVSERLELRPKTWTGSHRDWDNLDPSEQAKYDYVNFDDDYTPGGGASLGMIADNFNENLGYSIGDVVIHEENLYRFGSVHTAGDPWDPTEVTQTTVETEIENVKSEIPTNLGAAATKGVATSVQSGNNDLVTSDAVNTKINGVLSAMGIYENEVSNVSVPNATSFCKITLPAGTYIAVAVYQSSGYPYAYITTNSNKPQIYSNVDVFTLSQQTTIGLSQASGAAQTYSYAHLVALKIK